MRFWTIWTLPACTFGEKLRRTRDWAAQTVALHLPKRVRYWVAMQSIAHATRFSTNIPGATVEEILPRLDHPKVVT